MVIRDSVYAIIKGTLTEPASITNLVIIFGWIFLILAAIVIMVRSSEFRCYARSHLVESIFLFPYLWTLYTYNYPHWARGNFARFAIPILPFALLALYRWIPKTAESCGACSDYFNSRGRVRDRH